MAARGRVPGRASPGRQVSRAGLDTDTQEHRASPQRGFQHSRCEAGPVAVAVGGHAVAVGHGGP